MPLNGTQITTSYAQNAMIDAALGNGPSIQITHVALGDGLGARYEPFEGQTELRREKTRMPITKQHFVDENTVRIVVEFGIDIPAFWMREIGFFDAAGNLIFVTAGVDISEGYTSAFELIFDGYLNLSGVKNGLVVVNAPDDQLLAFQAVALAGQAQIRLEQFNQAEALRAASLY